MNLSTETGDQQAVNEAVNGSIYLAATNGVILTEMSGLDKTVPDETEGVLASETAEVCLAGMLIARTAMGSDVRLELVSALRERILAGTYRVGAEDVAEKLMTATLR